MELWFFENLRVYMMFVYFFPGFDEMPYYVQKNLITS